MFIMFFTIRVSYDMGFIQIGFQVNLGVLCSELIMCVYYVFYMVNYVYCLDIMACGLYVGRLPP